MLHIRYVSALCSQRVLDYIFETSKEKPQLAAQKFHRLTAQGFALHQNRCTIKTLSTIPVTPQNHSKKIWWLKSEKKDGLKYSYIPTLNVKWIKNLCVFFYTFFNLFFWALIRRPFQNRVIICDVLNLTTTAAALLAAKLSFTKSVAIVTDIPGMMVVGKDVKWSIKGRIYGKALFKLFTKFSSYILLTEAMDEVVNPKNRPYMIMEGLVDEQMEQTDNTVEGKDDNKIVIYAGGLFEKYGVKTLVDAFMEVENKKARLHLYGSGDMVEDFPSYSARDPRINYLGLVPNKQVVADQLAATLLVNPRPTTEEFTKYSFPSKNMEYMVSGTATATTVLQGMPREYYPYVFLLEDESVSGMKRKLEEVLSESTETLHQFGQGAKDFVLQYKNNRIQSGRILDFLSRQKDRVEAD